MKNRRAYGSALGLAELLEAETPPFHNHFGMVVVSCEGGDLMPMPDGVEIYADAERRVEKLPPPTVPRGEVIDELLAVVQNGETALHSGEWGMATTEICRAILDSGAQGREIFFEHQNG